MHRLFSDLRHGFRLLLRHARRDCYSADRACTGNRREHSDVQRCRRRSVAADSPFHDPDKLVMVWEDASQIGFPRNTPAPANWKDWREQNAVFTDIAASRGASFILTQDGSPERIIGRRVTASFWDVLGTPPVPGRAFTAEEDRTNAKVAVIAYGLWQRRYGGERSVLGRRFS